MYNVSAMVLGLRQRGVLQDLDVQLLDMIQRRYHDDVALPDVLQLTLALASRAINLSHVCLQLDAVDVTWILGNTLPAASGTAMSTPERALCSRLSAFCETIRNRDVQQGWLSQHSRIMGGVAQADTPFVLDGSRLYLRRFFHYEQRVADKLRNMAQASEEPLDAKLENRILALLPDNAEARRAAKRALTRKLCVISGGPGTGKTYTAARILHLLDERNAGASERLHVKVAAPTGKAAARVEESLIKAGRESLGAFRHAVIEPACTLDRLLGYQPGSPYFRHHVDNPLPADVVLMDEASMIDLPKMAKLLDALRADTRLILLGDMHQLASVAPGSVLGDLCEADALQDCVVRLTTSRRFGVDTPVGTLSAAVNGVRTEADADNVWNLLQLFSDSAAEAQSETSASVHVHVAPRNLVDGSGMIQRDFAKVILQGYGRFLEADTPAAAFQSLAAFRVLCATRHGPFGAQTMNRLVEKVLAQETIPRHALEAYLPKRKLYPSASFYDHRLIMITRNDYGLKLFNGDIGVLLPDPDNPRRLVVFFEAPSGAAGQVRFRKLSYRLLPEHESGFAMTVHKSQGSEFGNVLLLLPGMHNPVLTRELVYTGITRVSHRLDIWAVEQVFKQAVQSNVARFSGLSERLS